MCSYNAKLALLKKTHEIEEEEMSRAMRRSSKIKEKAEEIRSKNARLSVMSNTETMFSSEEEERRELIAKMKLYAGQLGLTSITNILENFEGIFEVNFKNLHFYFKYFCTFK